MKNFAIYEGNKILQIMGGNSLEESIPEGFTAVEVTPDVMDNTHYIVDGVAIPFPEKPECCIWDWTSLAWIDEPLEDTQARKWSEIKKVRSEKEFGGFVWDGSTFDSDSESRNRIMGAVQLASIAATFGVPYSVTWTLADNSTRDLSGADMIQVALALGTHVANIFSTAVTLRENIDSSTDISGVTSIHWP